MINKKVTVGIYGDVGVSADSFFQLSALLSKTYQVIRLKAPDIINKNWPEEMKMLVFPGGADVPYDTKLKGPGCANIRAFVENGGIYVGVCAGSYFGSQEIHFTCADGKIIHEPRELSFFKGCAAGPTFGPYIEQGHVSASLAEIAIDGKIYNSYYNGGGYFTNAQVAENCKIEAIYNETKQPMAVECTVGMGYAFLCGIHPEYDQDFINKAIAKKVQGYNHLISMNTARIDLSIKNWFINKIADYIKINSNIRT